MNYYPHHIGDFNNATRHLTRVERSLYRDAIELYYDTELPLTLDFTKLCRRLLVSEIADVEALKVVLDEFFTETEAGFYHSRCEIEIAKYKEKAIGQAAAGIASAAKRKQKVTDVERTLNAGLADAQPTRTITNNHNQEKTHSSDNPPELEKAVCVFKSNYGEVAKSLVRAGVQSINPSNPTFIALVDSGASPTEFYDIVIEQKAKNGKFDFNYILAIVKSRRSDAAKMVLHQGAMPATTSREQGRNIAAKSIFTPENTKHLQGNQLKTIEVEHEQRAITA